MARAFVDLTGTALAANAVFLGGTANGATGNVPGGTTAVSAGGSDGVGDGQGQARTSGDYENSNRFGAVVHTDQSGTLYIDGASRLATLNWRQVGSIVVTAGVAADLDVPVRFTFYRTRFVNGGTATTAANTAIHSSFRSGQ